MQPDGPRLTPAEVAAAEKRLGPEVRFPEDYRSWLIAVNGAEAWFGDLFLMLYSLADVIAVTEAADATERLPGFVAFGSDGSRETIAFDFRKMPPPVVMVDLVAQGWSDGLLQAESFSEFMAQRERQDPLVWDRAYA